MSAGWMLRRPAPFVVWILACSVPLLAAVRAEGYQLGARWTSTATGSTGSVGSPAKLTWSFAKEGTSIPAPNSGLSSLIAFLDGQFGAGPGGTDLTGRPWYGYFSQPVDRWSQLSGASFTYESHDNGSEFQNSAGITGIRGDIRIAGAPIDGVGNTLAVTSYPNAGDIRIDTGDGATFSNASSNHLTFRNTIAHELGHALGLAHVNSNTNGFLMAPNISTSFDGPQLDDILGVQSYYGDVYEKSNGGLGNDIASRATSLGALAVGGTKSIGTSAATAIARAGQMVLPSDIDFVSIDGTTDTDFFSFSVSGSSRLSVQLTPRGFGYNQGPDEGSQVAFNSAAASDLTLAVIGTNGTTQLALANSAPAGEAEIRSGVALAAAGQYYVRVSGSTSIAQFYDLQLSLAAAFITGDYNRNGKVDAGDYAVWRDSLGSSGLSLAADGDGNGKVDAADFGVWKTNFGASSGAGGGGESFGGAAPEPASWLLAMVGGVLVLAARAREVVRALRRADGG